MVPGSQAVIIHRKTRRSFLMTGEAVMDRLVEAMNNVKFEIIATDMSKDQEQKLREAFGHQ
jgi:uncharacterized membrane protein